MVTTGHKFSFKNKLYLLDTITIDLCLCRFPWAEFRKRKGAIKLHMGIDADGYLPTFMDMTVMPILCLLIQSHAFPHKEIDNSGKAPLNHTFRSSSDLELSRRGSAYRSVDLFMR